MGDKIPLDERGQDSGGRHRGDLQRVARTAAAVEPAEQDRWEAAFYEVLRGFRFLPGGRILAGAGTARRVTLFNCFVMGLIEDDMESIF